MSTRSRPCLTPRLIVLALGAALSSHATAGSWMWDVDGNRIDDRIEKVEADGLAFAYENQDMVNGRVMFAVEQVAPGLKRYPVYVGFERYPTDADVDAIRASGVDTTILHRFLHIDYVQMALTFEDIRKVAQLPGVRQIESVPAMYALNNVAVKSSGASFSNYRRFPTVHENLGLTGKGVVVGIMDTGVNDAYDPVTRFPGHEAFTGKFIAGGNFFAGNPNLNTPVNQSENPVDRGEKGSNTHGTHVAGTTFGTGGISRVFGGVAPGSMMVDLKVLSDAGAGFGSANGIDWAIANKDKYGIRVLNLSLGGSSASDGKDANSQAINRAYAAGIVSVVAAGNDGKTGYMPSPAAADRALTVGSLADQNTIHRADDMVSSFSNEGPRLSDGDADFVDEMKPVVSAAGSNIMSADGSLATDGRQYMSLSGTSMATPHTAGVIALLLEANPALTPEQVFEIIKHTSDHRTDWGKTPASSRPFPSGDPNYHPSGGWGQVDAYAAAKEALRLGGDPASQVQVIRIEGDADPAAGKVTLRWVSQREIALQGYNVYRAEDVNGAPGVFTRLNGSLIPGTGQAAIEGRSNRNTYTWQDQQGLSAGRVYWYRVEHVSAAGTFQEPAYPVALGEPQPVAQLRYSITHNAIANDLTIMLGTGPEVARASFVVDGAPQTQAVKVTTEPGDATIGTQRHDFVINLTALDRIGSTLPASNRNPWFLQVKDAGFVNRTGRINSFELVTFDSQGNVTGTYGTKDPVPMPTIEKGSVEVWIPDNPHVTLPGEAPALISASPNAANAGDTVEVELIGGDFLPGASVHAGDGVTVTGVEVLSGVEMLATFAVAPNARSGPRDITVTNVDGSSDRLLGGFTVIGEDSGGGSDPVVVDLTDEDPAIEYRTGWHRKESADAMGGSYHRRAGNAGNGTDSHVRLVFDGTQVTYYFARSEGGGVADVYIDGKLVDTVSYAGTAPKQTPSFGHQVTYGGLTKGSHELRIVWRGGLAYVDGFQVATAAGQASTDGSAAQTRSSTSSSQSNAAVINHTVQVSDQDESLSVNVDGATGPITVEVLGPNGGVVAVAQSLLQGGSLHAADVAITTPGTYTVRVIQPGLQRDTLVISTARTVRVQ